MNHHQDDAAVDILRNLNTRMDYEEIGWEGKALTPPIK